MAKVKSTYWNMGRAGLGALLATVSLSGCASILLGPGDTPPRYTLQPISQPVPAAVASKMKIRLVIPDPQSEAAFDTSRIGRSPAPLRYEYYADGEWTDQLPQLWGIFLQRSFENDGRIETVGDRTTVPLGDYVLRTDIRAFHIEEREGARTARVSISAKLFNSRNETIATRIFSMSQPVTDQGLTAAVEAINRTAQVAGTDCVNWVIAEIEQNPPLVY